MPLSSTNSNAYGGMLAVKLNGGSDVGVALDALKTALNTKVSSVNPGDPKSMLEANIAMQEYEMMHSFIGGVFKTMSDTFDRIAQKM